ncbi:metallophosphoesterase family protein [Microbacterium sufflavum]|uniref:Phosphoesterase n=1 Tax=Microbacterium sufflavum TaxID=2851649 RepID=A0ABY4IHB2_9MICO|nr:YfcE family phosphodiesterase [Microbacterium sufflavum]UPL11532.1 YfcE family phosphodiesterase [Microbacterium sufflavum]
MTTRMLLLADTHVPKRAKRLPDAVLRAVDEADVVVHAGDWVDEATLDLLAERAAVLHAVFGNNDGPGLRGRLPEVARFRVEDTSVAVIHETGGATGRERRMDAAFPDDDLLVFGHSHIPWDTVTPRGLRLLNAGSPTDRRRQPVCTLMTVVIDGADIDATLVPLS